MKKLLVVDVETGGLDPEYHSIVSFAAVIYHEGSVAGTFYTLVQDSGLTTEQAFRVNGIGVGELAGAPAPWDAVKAFELWLARNQMVGQQVLAGHNVAFDAGFIRRLWRLAGADYDKQFSHRRLCTQAGALLLEQAGRIVLPGGSASLDNVAAVLGAGERRGTPEHDALDDALLTAKVLKKMVEKLQLHTEVGRH